MRGAGTRFKPSDPSLGLLASDLIVLSLGSPRAELPGSPCALLPSPYLPLAAGQPRPALVSCSNGSSDPYCIVKVDNEPIIRYAPPQPAPAPPHASRSHPGRGGDGSESI